MILATLCASVLSMSTAIGAGLSPGLSIEQIAPEQTVLTISIQDVSKAIKRFEGLSNSEHIETFNQSIESMTQNMPDAMSKAWADAAEDSSMLKLIEGLRMGVAVFPVVDSETTAISVGMTFFCELGSSDEFIGEIWDLGVESMQEDGLGSNSMEIVELSDRDVIRIDLKSDESDEADEDPFGGGGGMNIGSTMAEIAPSRLYMVKDSGHLLLSTSRTQMERMLDLIDSKDLEGGLGETDAYKAISEMVAPGQFQLLVMTDHLTDLIKSMMPQPFMVDMAKSLVIAMIGRIDAMGVSFSAGEGSTLFSFELAAVTPQEKTGLTKLLADNTGREPLPAWLPADAVGYTRFNFDMAGVLPWIKNIISSNPLIAMQAGESMAQIEPMIDKLVTPLGNTIRSSRSISYPLNAQSSTTLTAVEVRDGKALSDALSEMLPQMGFEPRDFQGYQVYSVDLGGVMPIPGLGGEIAIAVGGEELFIGDAAAVEQALRTVGKRTDAGIPTALAFKGLSGEFSNDPVSIWGVTNLGASLGAEAKIAKLVMDQEMETLRQDDPELADELAEMMGDDSEEGGFFDNFAEWIGLAGFELSSVDRGFKGRGWILPKGDD